MSHQSRRDPLPRDYQFPTNSEEDAALRALIKRVRTAPDVVCEFMADGKWYTVAIPASVLHQQADATGEP